MMEIESLSLIELIALRNELNLERQKRVAYVVNNTEVRIDTLVQYVHTAIHNRIINMVK